MAILWGSREHAQSLTDVVRSLRRREVETDAVRALCDYLRCLHQPRHGRLMR